MAPQALRVDNFFDDVPPAATRTRKEAQLPITLRHPGKVDVKVALRGHLEGKQSPARIVKAAQDLNVDCFLSPGRRHGRGHIRFLPAPVVREQALRGVSRGELRSPVPATVVESLTDHARFPLRLLPEPRQGPVDELESFELRPPRPGRMTRIRDHDGE